mmetsp:Transcript_2195/g.4497  ORF Transcript_2195/g.4497 Transcript_2195/m.4497 type:complete len:244 (-) Transcript_2195:1380-2111(-)
MLLVRASRRMLRSKGTSSSSSSAAANAAAFVAGATLGALANTAGGVFFFDLSTTRVDRAFFVGLSAARGVDWALTSPPALRLAARAALASACFISICASTSRSPKEVRFVRLSFAPPLVRCSGGVRRRPLGGAAIFAALRTLLPPIAYADLASLFATCLRAAASACWSSDATQPCSPRLDSSTCCERYRSSTGWSPVTITAALLLCLRPVRHSSPKYAPTFIRGRSSSCRPSATMATSPLVIT